MGNLDDDERWLRQFGKGSPIVAGLFGAGLAGTLIAFFWFVPQPSDFQRQLARWIVAMCSAYLSVFFVGGIVLRGSIKGTRLTAVGSFALFVLLITYVNPFPKPSQPPGQPEWAGGVRLGSLLTELADAYADGRIVERIVIDPAHHDEINNFKVESGEWTGRTWIDLMQKICLVATCLECRTRNKETLEITISGPLEKRCINSTCSQYWFTCKP